ncbi:unnamed protein product [Arabidopsis halleri]
MTTKMVSSHRLLTLMVFVLLLIPMISGGQITDKCTEGCRSEMACNLHCLKRGLGHCEKAILHDTKNVYFFFEYNLTLNSKKKKKKNYTSRGSCNFLLLQ